jgi:3-oxoacyl-[acyl-carrier-protein] synthase-1
VRRVVITGLGIVSSIGTTQAQVADSLREVRSGIELSEEYRELGFRSHVH